MRHYKKGRKLGTDASHTKAIKKNLVVNLFTNDRIKTTLERAKEIRGDVDRVVTWAKRGDVHSRRLAIAKLGNKDLVAEIFSKVEQGMFAGRPGGYSRILRLGMRRGDSATIVIMELVLEPLSKKTAKAADEKPVAKKAAAKKVTKKAADEAVAEEAAEETVGDETLAAEETPATEEAPAEEAPASEDAPEAAPEAADTSAEEALAAEDAPESEEAPASESNDDVKAEK
jgi:large subunit ribosomal protein L17